MIEKTQTNRREEGTPRFMWKPLREKITEPYHQKNPLSQEKLGLQRFALKYIYISRN